MHCLYFNISIFQLAAPQPKMGFSFIIWSVLFHNSIRSFPEPLSIFSMLPAWVSASLVMVKNTKKRIDNRRVAEKVIPICRNGLFKSFKNVDFCNRFHKTNPVNSRVIITNDSHTLLFDNTISKNKLRLLKVTFSIEKSRDFSESKAFFVFGAQAR